VALLLIQEQFNLFIAEKRLLLVGVTDKKTESTIRTLGSLESAEFPLSGLVIAVNCSNMLKQGFPRLTRLTSINRTVA